MTETDKEFFAWCKRNFGDGALPGNWKELYAEYLLKNKTKSQLWKMLCGPATKSCLCKCPCAAGIAWDKLLSHAQG